MEPFRYRRSFLRFPVKARGFTLVELLVVLGIITVILGIVLSNQGSFNKTLVLANTAYDLALTIRSAETYGISSRATSASPNTGYGVHFQSGSSNSFTFFADTSPAASCTLPGCTPPGDHIYTAGSDVLVQTYQLGNGITIQKFCVYTNGWNCFPGPNVSSLDIVYSRPNPIAYISKNGVYSATNSTVCLVLASPQGTTRSISVWTSGAINANAPCNP